MADDYPTDLTNAELAEALRQHGTGVEATADELADAIDSSDGPTPSDLGAVVTDTLELLGLLGDTIAPGIEPADDKTDDYRAVAHAARVLLDCLDTDDEDSNTATDTE